MTVDKLKQIIAEEQWKKSIDSVMQIGHVFSLTPIIDNDCMWALYASNFTGMAIGYKAVCDENTGDKYTIKIDKEKNLQLYNEILSELNLDNRYAFVDDYRIKLTPVSYNNEQKKVFNFCDEKYSIPSENIFVKKNVWSYENEFRSVIMSLAYTNKPLRLYYPDEVLDCIVFGYKTPIDKINRIKTTIERHYSNKDSIKYFKIVPDYENQKLILAES